MPLTLLFSPPQELTNAAPRSQCNPMDGKMRKLSPRGGRCVSLPPVGIPDGCSLRKLRCSVAVFGTQARVV